MNARAVMAWSPAVVLAAGAIFTVGIDTQRAVPLAQPIDVAVPAVLEGIGSTDQVMPEDERRVAGVYDYLLRTYAPADSAALAAGGHPFSLYVGYYERQTQGRTIHSPKNCLPGAGWEALQSTTATVPTADGPVEVNRYFLQHDTSKELALVLYWYQGRGRVEWNEYVVKWDLLRDAALRQRTEEALVRIVVPLINDLSQDEALAYAVRLAEQVVPAVNAALPT